MDTKQFDKLVEELVSIKKLLILQLLQNEVSVTRIAQVLGVTQGRISQIVPTRKNKKGGQSNG